MFDFIYRKPIKFIYRRLINFIYRELKKQQKQICLPKQTSVNYYPWLVAHNDDSGDQIFYNIHDPQSCYKCRIPELVGRRIQACFHGWFLLSNHHHTHWFLWNPNSTLIRLPPLLLKSWTQCCLSSPPGVPGSILLLGTLDKPNFVFCRLDRERKRLRWIEMSYAEQLRSITGRHDVIEILDFLTCCNGEVYAASSRHCCVVKIHIEVKENSNSDMISLLPFVNSSYPPKPFGRAVHRTRIFIESSLEPLVIYVGYADVKRRKPIDIYLFKLDISSMAWVEVEELKDTSLYLEEVGDNVVGAVASEFGGYVHIIHKEDKVVYSYNVKDKNHLHVFSKALSGLDTKLCRADERKEDEMVVRSAAAAAKEVVQEEEEEIEADHVLNLPFHVLERILEFCAGVEYLNFRATCKLCHLAAPLINRKVPQRRLKTYSSVSSPWLMRFDKRGGIITFTDPMFGDNYFIRAEEIVSNSIVMCSMYGWLLLLTGSSRLTLFNPFTNETRELPARRGSTGRFCFSAPPTSPHCMVMGFSGFVVFFHFVAGEPIWYRLVLDISVSLEFPTICGQHAYGLRNKGQVDVFRGVGRGGQVDVLRGVGPKVVVDRLPTSSCIVVEYFLTTCNQDLLLLMVGDFGEEVEVFKLTEELEWEKMDGLGRHAIYVCEAISTCLCMAAKTPEMENKIFFSRLHSKNGKVMFYSLETRRFHTFDGRNVGLESSVEDFYQHTCSHAWIEPTWSHGSVRGGPAESDDLMSYEKPTRPILKVFKPRSLVDLAAAVSSALLMNEPQWVGIIVKPLNYSLKGAVLHIDTDGLEDRDGDRNSTSVVKELYQVALKDGSIEFPDWSSHIVSVLRIPVRAINDSLASGTSADLLDGFAHGGRGDGRPTSAFFPLVVPSASRAGILFSISLGSTTSEGNTSLWYYLLCDMLWSSRSMEYRHC
ncbi:hypothetical protein OSB04_004484 [Centaurea solstitialis]|uniref:KIB1-4 beta-propeller domain-containing protein n=1 Tax=Centaurea solstitialis TaxID=347529 RepID=A0AA38U497_9ASTR|nr:hypothetical protein OSB04_004484 [Centaurea solstitialis]